jgi:hypothetical protein
LLLPLTSSSSSSSSSVEDPLSLSLSEAEEEEDSLSDSESESEDDEPEPLGEDGRGTLEGSTAARVTISWGSQAQAQTPDALHALHSRFDSVFFTST